MKRGLKFMAIIIALFLFIPITARAESEVTLDTEITKQYISIIFKVTVENEVEDCIVAVYSPDGTEYMASKDEDNIYKCSVNNVSPGKWSIKAYSEAGEDLGRVSAKLEASRNEASEDNGEIKVVSDITGLRVYMKDDYIVCDWSDNSIGSVSIKVVNSINLQTLDKKTVGKSESCYYEYKIPDEVEEVIVTVVPSASSNIADASKSFVIPTKYSPDADVIYTDKDVTNEQYIDTTVSLNNTYKVITYASNKFVEESEYLSAGEYLFSLPVTSGNNDYSIYIVDEKNNMKSFQKNLQGDFLSPTLSVNNSSQSLTQYTDSYKISGTVTDYTSLTINDKEVDIVYQDDTFSYDYLLHEGSNDIVINAYDEAGNVSSCTITVNYIIKKDDKSSIIILTCLAIFLFLIIVALLVRKKLFGSKEEESVKKKVKKEKGKDSVPKKKKEREDRKSVQPKEKLNNNKRRYSYIVSPLIVVIFVFILMKFLIFRAVIQSNSMQPLISKDDVVIFNRLSYVANEVERGDVICFWSDEENKYLAKRVIGLPNDVIAFVDGYTVINGVTMDESMYLAYDTETNCDQTFIVPENSYFVLGDNRENSKDSRYFNNPYVDRNTIIGKYLGITGFTRK